MMTQPALSMEEQAQIKELMSQAFSVMFISDGQKELLILLASQAYLMGCKHGINLAHEAVKGINDVRIPSPPDDTF